MSEPTWQTHMFRDRDAAESAVQQLREMGYGQDEISVMMADQAKAKMFADSTGSSAAKGAAAGAGIGGGLGAIIAGLTATGSIAAVAGTGGAAAPLVAGPLAAALAGLGVGGVGGGIVGALIGVGIPKAKAHAYERDLERGGILIGVRPQDRYRDRLAHVLPEETDSGQVTTIGNGGSTPRGDADVGDEDPQTGEHATFSSHPSGDRSTP